MFPVLGRSKSKADAHGKTIWELQMITEEACCKTQISELTGVLIRAVLLAIPKEGD